jgi:hypothetical protein
MEAHKDSRPITLDDWFELLCGFGPKLQQKNVTTSARVLQSFETIKVTVDPFTHLPHTYTISEDLVTPWGAVPLR